MKELLKIFDLEVSNLNNKFYGMWARDQYGHFTKRIWAIQLNTGNIFQDYRWNTNK